MRAWTTRSASGCVRGLRLAAYATGDTAGTDKASSERRRVQDLERLDTLQERLYAEGGRALLVVFQAMDAAGKDGTIEHVMSGVNPQGVRVTSFKQPTQRPSWRTAGCGAARSPCPPRGEIGIFNRSHYEEVVAVRVHPEWLAAQAIDPRAARTPRSGSSASRTSDAGSAPGRTGRACEVLPPRLPRRAAQALPRPRRGAREELEVLSRRRRGARPLGRLPARFDAALGATSTKDSPWYVIPADRKWFMRTAVASILVHHLEDMDPQFPEPTAEDRAMMDAAVEALEAE